MTEKKSKNIKTKTRLNIKLEKKLVAYMLGAGAAAWLSTSESAEAKIVYTSANLHSSGDIVLDLNHDGIADFSTGFIGRHYYSYFGVGLGAGNAVQYSPEFVGLRGNIVGPGGSFGSGTFYTFYAVVLAVSHYPTLSGEWVNVTNRYLGLKFLINGQVHYGWARMSLSSHDSQLYVVSGYAYETVPNKEIAEGATSDTAELDVLEQLDDSRPAGPSLGMLARGVEGVAFWRRDYTPVAYKRSDEIA